MMRYNLKHLQPLVAVALCVFMAMVFTNCSKEDEESRYYYYYENDAEVDGIAYNIVSLDELTVGVVPKTEPNNYTGAITIPSNVMINGKNFTVTSILNYAFSGSSVTAVTLPPTVTVIGYGAFNGCENLKSLTIPPSVEKIGDGAFNGCENLKSLTIPPSVEEIGDGAFESSGLEQITIPATVKAIGQYVFRECKNLKKVTIEDSNEPLKVHFNAIDKDDGEPDILPFYGSPIETLYCGRNTVARDIVNYCPVELGISGVWYVENDWSYTLKYLTLGEAVTELEPVVRPYKADLVSITCKGTTPPIGSSKITPKDCFMKTIVYVPSSAVETYKADEYWGKFWNIESIK